MVLVNYYTFSLGHTICTDRNTPLQTAVQMTGLLSSPPDTHTHTHTYTHRHHTHHTHTHTDTHTHKRVLRWCSHASVRKLTNTEKKARINLYVFSHTHNPHPTTTHTL